MTFDEISRHISAPVVDTARASLEFIQKSVADAGLMFKAPHLTFDPHEDEVLMEWWVGRPREAGRKLEIYVRRKDGSQKISVEALKIWGPNTRSEMEDVVVDGSETVVSLWRWLTTCP